MGESILKQHIFNYLLALVYQLVGIFFYNP